MRGSTFSKGHLDTARSFGFEVVTTDEARDMGIGELTERIRRRVGEAQAFVTFDVDFVDPAYAPGTGTPEIGGFTSAEAVSLIRGLQGLHLIGADIVEVAPAFDPTGVTALLASNIAYEVLSLLALAKKRAGGNR